MNIEDQIKKLRNISHENRGYFDHDDKQYRFKIRELSDKRIKKEEWPSFLLPLELCILEREVGVFQIVDKDLFNDNIEELITEARNWLNKSKYRYFIIGNSVNDHYHAIDKYNDKSYTRHFYPNILKHFIQGLHDYKTSNRIQHVLESIRERLSAVNIEDEYALSSLKKNVDSVIYNPIRNKYTFPQGSFQNVEFNLMGVLLKCNRVRHLSRYCSLDSALRILEEKKINMNCIYGMNDASERNYAAARMGLDKGEEIDENTHLNKIHSINNKFILSCSFKHDNLDLWRLYASDGNGVSISFDLGTEFYSNYHTYFSHGFFVGYVSYGEENGNHPILDGLSSYYNGCSDLGEQFYMKHEDVWKHFFKPHSFASEHEVRIFYYNKGEKKTIERPHGFDETKIVKKELKWRQGRNGILNPYVTFELSEFKIPLRLDSLTIGPGLTEKTLNYQQLRAYLKRINERDKNHEKPITVRPSKIDNYRRN